MEKHSSKGSPRAAPLNQSAGGLMHDLLRESLILGLLGKPHHIQWRELKWPSRPIRDVMLELAGPASRAVIERSFLLPPPIVPIAIGRHLHHVING